MAQQLVLEQGSDGYYAMFDPNIGPLYVVRRNRYTRSGNSYHYDVCMTKKSTPEGCEMPRHSPDGVYVLVNSPTVEGERCRHPNAKAIFRHARNEYKIDNIVVRDRHKCDIVSHESALAKACAGFDPEILLDALKRHQDKIHDILKMECLHLCVRLKWAEGVGILLGVGGVPVTSSTLVQSTIDQSVTCHRPAIEEAMAERDLSVFAEFVRGDRLCYVNDLMGNGDTILGCVLMRYLTRLMHPTFGAQDITKECLSYAAPFVAMYADRDGPEIVQFTAIKQLLDLGATLGCTHNTIIGLVVMQGRALLFDLLLSSHLFDKIKNGMMDICRSFTYIPSCIKLLARLYNVPCPDVFSSMRIKGRVIASPLAMACCFRDMRQIRARIEEGCVMSEDVSKLMRAIRTGVSQEDRNLGYDRAIGPFVFSESHKYAGASIQIMTDLRERYGMGCVPATPQEIEDAVATLMV